MKKKLFISTFAALLLWSCCEDYADKDVVKDSPIDPVTNLEATPYVGAVILNWDLPENEQYYYSVVSYVDNNGQKVDRKVSKFSVDSENPNRIRAVIPGFTDTNEYEFSVTAYNYAGSASETVSVKATPEDKSKAKDYIVKTVKFTPGVESAKITWENELDADLTLVVKHFDYYNPGKPTTELVDEYDASTPKTEIIENLPIEENIVMTYFMRDNETGDESETLTQEFEVEVPVEHIYDPAISYVFNNFFNANVMEYTFNNETKTEFTITSTGTDAYAYSKFDQNPTGTILVFRYKSETNIKNLRLYLDYPPSKMVQYKDYTVHDPKGYDGLRNTNGYWRTVRWNLTDACKKTFNFMDPSTINTGASSHRIMRLDPNKQNKKVHTFRNMHWEVDPKY